MICGIILVADCGVYRFNNMKIFSLRTLIDDILLIVRNNNISESEDLSRDQIRAWIVAYKAYLAKKQKDKDKEDGSDDTGGDEDLESTIGPLKLRPYGDDDECCFQTKRTKEKLPDLIGNEDDSILNITDKYGCTIQIMSEKRLHFHRFRRYTYAEPACWYNDGYIYVSGSDIDDLDEIYVSAKLAENPGDSEDDQEIPGWMIPEIKKAIMENELSFMLKRPSDDSNNSTLASVKPHGPQDKEK